MDSEVAGIMLYCLAGIALLVWLASVEYVRRTRLQSTGGTPGQRVQDFFPDETSSAGWLLGEATVKGAPAALSDKMAAALAAPAGLGVVPLKLTEKADDHISFEWPGPALVGQQRVWWFRRGQLRFNSLGGGTTRVGYAIELKPILHWLRIASIIQFFGLVGIVTLFWVLHTFVVPAQEVGVRWQVVQMVQAVHLLWPPFLFVTMYRRARENVITRFDTFLHNLPFLGN
jgi:hypothetical protein